MASTIVASAGANTTTDTTGMTLVNIVHGTHSQLVAFLVLNIWPSHFGLPLLLAVIYFRKIQRHVTFVNLCVTFIIAGISSSLLAYAGKTSGPEPSPILCLLQASLLYGYPPMTSVAAFALVLQMFLVIRASHYGEEYLDKNHVIRNWIMIISPYIAFFVVVLTTAIVGSGNPSEVSRSRRFFYCSVRSQILTGSLVIFAAAFLLALLVLEVWLLFILYKRYTTLKSNGFNVKEEMDYSMPLRVLAYGLFIIIALSLSLLAVKAPNSPVPDLIIATAATVMLAIFATQRDVIKGVCFWRKEPADDEKLRIVVSRDQDEISYYSYNIGQPDSSDDPRMPTPA